MQAHLQYLLRGAFLRMRKMLAFSEKVRFVLAQDSSMLTACSGAFSR